MRIKFGFDFALFEVDSEADISELGGTEEMAERKEVGFVYFNATEILEWGLKFCLL